MRVAWIASFLSGALFAVGLAIAGMTRPDRVIGFLDVTGDWKPGLALVMGGAIAVHFLAYRIVPKLQRPLFESRFGIPTRRDVDPRLVGGAALFGLGWGLGGYCPGPGLASLVTGDASALLFVFSMIAGMVLARAWEERRVRVAASAS
jgi:hypothetical protein